MKLPYQQVIDTIKGSKKVLVTTSADVHEDSLAAVLAMYLLLQKMKVPAEVLVPNIDHKLRKCRFMPAIDKVQTGGQFNQLVVHIPMNGGGIADFRYEIEGDALKIYVTPNDGGIDASRVSSRSSAFDYDLIVVCDAPDLNSLGEIYTDNAEFFYKTPIINIDHNVANESFGQINCIDINAVSTTEVIVKLFEEALKEHVDADIATLLLAGMISKTKSFQTGKTTPQSLRIASELVEKGARRDEIIENLYRQHKLHTLRLWGRVLARLENSTTGLAYSYVRQEDYAKSGAGEDDLPGIIEELLVTSPEARRVILLYEKTDGHIGGWLKTEPHVDALQLTLAWQGVGSHSLVNFTVNSSKIEDAKEQIKALFN